MVQEDICSLLRFVLGELSMERFFLLHKGGQVEFQLPGRWKVLKNAVLRPEGSSKPIYSLVGDALDDPLGTGPLRELVHPSDRIAVVVDDCTRPTPRKEMLACILDRLLEYGVSWNNVDIVFALGTHRPMTADELSASLGKLRGKVRYWNHNACASDLVCIGRLPAAGEIKINPVVAAAGLRISVGSILPHPLNGFGGGAKNIFPGVGNLKAICDHHNKLMLAEGVALGNITGNPFYGEICEAAGLARLDFIVNAVFDAHEDVKAIVAGDYLKAYECGVEMSRKGYAVEIAEKADVTIASTFPHEQAPQLIKPLCMAAEVTKDAGFVILYARRIAGGRFPEDFLRAFDAAYNSGYSDMKELVSTCIREGRLVASGAPMDFNCALNMALVHMSRIRAILVSKEVSPDEAARLGFIHAQSIPEAVKMIERTNREATVNILPSGGLTVRSAGGG